MRMQYSFVLSILALAVSMADFATAQAASFTRFGAGCGSSPPPLLNARSVPKLGSNFTFTYVGPNGRTPVSDDLPVLLLGANKISVLVPPISSIQPKNCFVYVSPLIVAPMPWTGTRYQSSVTLTIPNDRRLLGATLQQQFVAFYFNCRSTPCQFQMLRTTNGATSVVGT